MRKQQTYGKRSAAAYSAIALSSPDQVPAKTTKPVTTDAIEKTPIRANESRKRAVKGKKPDKADRTALGERSHNTVVEPVELVQHLSRKCKKLQSREDAGEETQPKKATKLIFNDDDDGYVVAFGDDQAGKKSMQVTEVVTNTRRHRRRKNGDTEELSIHDVKVSHPQDNTYTLVTDTDDTQGADSVGCHSENPYEQHCKALLAVSQHPLTCFHTWSSQLSEHFDVTKIAEASFGEVYRLSLRETMSDFSIGDESVFKIIPLFPAESALPLDKRKRVAALKKAEFMSKPHDVANEVKLLQRMSAIPGFTNFRDVRILQGRPPKSFIAAFKAWNASQKAKEKNLSHWPDPAKKTSYNDEQLWAVIEMQDAGTDLERLVEDGLCSDVWSAWDAFWQVVLSLAKGEENASFEHRDLHLGNICVRLAGSDTTKDIDLTRKLNFTDLETTIIDYTISRCSMPNSPIPAYTDLSLDPALFEGDSSEEYQYDIYRYMRSVLHYDSALADFYALQTTPPTKNERNWSQYHPQTNLVWLHLVLYKLLQHLSWPSSAKAPNRKTRREEYRLWKRANDLEHVLLKVQGLLDPEMICHNGIWSAGDLVVFALQEGWLDVEDVTGHDEKMGGDSVLVSQLEGLELE